MTTFKIDDKAELWMLFSDSADQPGHSVLDFHIVKFFFAVRDKTGAKSEDESGFFHLYQDDEICGPPVGVKRQVVVTQANLRRVGMAMQRQYRHVRVQYLGMRPN